MGGGEGTGQGLSSTGTVQLVTLRASSALIQLLKSHYRGYHFVPALNHFNFVHAPYLVSAKCCRPHFLLYRYSFRSVGGRPTN